jgi:biopolymer transport protein ExbB
MVSCPVFLASFGDGLHAVWHFLAAGGIFMAFIVVCSFIAVAVIIAKFIDLRTTSVMPPRTVALLMRLHVGEALTAAEVHQTLTTDGTPLGKIASAALLDRHATKEEAMAAAQSVAREEVVKLERGVPLLEALITAAPLLGLLGAVVGLVKVFSGFSIDIADPSKIAPGIAQALNTTIAGLIVAIPSVFFHSYFARKIEHVAARMEVLIQNAVTTCFAASPVSSPAAVHPRHQAAALIRTHPVA